MKKIVIFLIIMLILAIGNFTYQKYFNTVECWWGVLYPSLSYIGFEEEDTDRISSSDKNYIYIAKDDDVHYKFLLLEWLHENFNW